MFDSKRGNITDVPLFEYEPHPLKGSLAHIVYIASNITSAQGLVIAHYLKHAGLSQA